MNVSVTSCCITYLLFSTLMLRTIGQLKSTAETKKMRHLTFVNNIVTAAITTKKDKPCRYSLGCSYGEWCKSGFCANKSGFTGYCNKIIPCKFPFLCFFGQCWRLFTQVFVYIWMQLTARCLDFMDFNDMTLAEKIKNAEAFKSEGTEFVKAENWTMALKKYIEVVELLKSNEDWETEEGGKRGALLLAGHTNKALCHLKLAEYKEAMLCCNEALRLDSKNEKALFRRGLANVNLKNFKDALTDFKDVLQVNPNNKAATTQLNEIKKEFKEETVAGKDMLTFDDVEDFRPVYLKKGIHLIENGQREAAFDLLKELKELSPPECARFWDSDLEFLKKYDMNFVLAYAMQLERVNDFGYDYYILKAKRLKEDCQIINALFTQMQAKLKDVDSKRMVSISRKIDLVKNMNTILKSSVEKERYFKILQSTVAIEGNEFTLDNVREYLRTKKMIKGRTELEHKEVQEAAFVINHVNNLLPTSLREINKAFLLNLHHMTLNSSQPAHAGRIRDENALIGSHEPPQPGEIQQHLDIFVNWLNHLAPTIHPVEAAARAHSMLSHIHPFADGNGRLCRLLVNIILCMNGYPSIDIPVERKLDYCSGLSMADDGYMRPFISFVMECVELTLDDYLSSR